ncbi:MAG: ATP-dependent Clp protease proteolytic subunit [Anaerolineae bacterium]|nr:ATP-dependent Clp protease proteolytic subunit [Anaerolineae bacterium]
MTSLLIPTVIENTGRTERAYDIYSMLLNNRIIFLGAAIDDRLANLVVAQLLYLNQQDPEQEISLYINSPGGNVYAGLAIYDTMQAISNPVATWAVGLTASMATILLAAGTAGRRIALSHATVHMHPAGGGTQGYTTDVEIQYKELKRMDDLGQAILAKHTGQSIETIAADFERDRWMDAETAKEYGLVDAVSGQSTNGEAADKK